MGPTVFDSLTAQAVKTVPTGTAEKVTTAAVSAGQGILVQSDPANSAVIYLGHDATVTAAPAVAHTALQPGEPRWFPLTSTDRLFCISATASQKLLVGIGK